MNNNYPGVNVFPGQPIYTNDNIAVPNMGTVPTVSSNIDIPLEQSYIENILRLNKGKYGKFYVSFPDSIEWKDKIFTGVVEQAGRDHLIISDPSTGKWYLILMIYLNYVEFEENINYSPDFTLKGL